MNSPNRLLGLIRHNVQLKVLAIILAIVCWFLVREETSYEQLVAGIPVEITPPEGWTIRSQTPAKVAVLVRGSRSDIRGLTDENVKISLGMKDNGKEANTVKVSSRHVRSPAGVRALRVEPSIVNVQLEKK